MPDLFKKADTLTKDRHIYTVSQITRDIKLILENTFAEVWVEGEISNFSVSAAGHCYFSLRDSSALLPSAMFSRAYKDVKFKIENGLKVICFGTIDVYEPHGAYKLIVQRMEPKGIGSLQLALEQLKTKLEKEGLFAPQRKRPIPYLPSTVGVVTSLSGAAIKDILKVLERRFSDARILIRPAQVQGDSAKEDIARAIEELNAYNEQAPPEGRIEVMIVGRGGGSMEDLWAFNEEAVARAIYNSKIPVISAVGHERDWTIADLVADVRAATPSVAAELVMPRKEDLKERLGLLLQDLRRSFTDMVAGLEEASAAAVRRLLFSMEHNIRLHISGFEALKKKLALLNPLAIIEQHRARIEDLRRQIWVRMVHFLQLKEAQAGRAFERLEGLSPLSVLSRGYSITFKIPGGAVLRDPCQVAAGDMIRTRLHKGEIISRVTERKEVSRDGRD